YMKYISILLIIFASGSLIDLDIGCISRISMQFVDISRPEVADLEQDKEITIDSRLNSLKYVRM
ncbi:MAG: hypothetical protein MHMPM18_002447, partial [Marteilia pararefringens]